MTNIKTKAPYEYMESKQFKLFDFVPEFFEFCEYDDLSRFGCESIDNNFIRLEKRGKIHFENRVAVCTSCKSKKSVKNEIYERKLIFLRIGERFVLFKSINAKNVVK